MKIIIVEDEKLAADRIEEMLRSIDPSIEVQARLTSIESSIQWLTRHTPDLIFMDIQLSDGLSFSIFDAVGVTSPVIFTTAYDQYAIDAFKVNSIDYLLKPVRLQDLRDSLKKYRTVSASYRADLEEAMRSARNPEAGYKKRFLIQFGEIIRKVQTDEIGCFYALEKNVFLTTFDKHTYPVDHSLETLESLLDPDQFFRINRKMIINFAAIQSMVPYSRSRVRIDLSVGCPNGIEPLVSVERAAAFKAWMDQ